MVDQRVEKLAKLCVNYSVGVKPKETVLIQGATVASPLMHELYKECLQSDAYPTVFSRFDFQYTFYKFAKEHHLQHVPSLTKFAFENFDVFISIFGEANTRTLTNIDPEKIRKHQESGREIFDIFIKREAEGKLRWNGLPYPAYAEAQEAEMALSEYEDFVYSSCLVDQNDPTAEWKRIHSDQDKICSFLGQKNEIRLVGEDTDLTFSVKGRKWINCSGQKNLPDGEVYTGPVEDSADGNIRFTYPGIFMGREIEDISLSFKAGKVVRASATKGDDFLQQVLKVEGADRIGEAAIGTNYGISRFTKNMLFDEKMGGTIHMALGMNPAPETGGSNKSALHWDILKDMKKDGEIYADGQLFYKNGKFMI
jgi:aminopeptidase